MMDTTPDTRTDDRGSPWLGPLLPSAVKHTDLDIAEGIVMGWQRCSAREAFDDLHDLACRHRLPTRLLAGELVRMVSGAPQESAVCRAVLLARWGRHLT